jgi:penicillin-binding protein 1A
MGLVRRSRPGKARRRTPGRAGGVKPRKPSLFGRLTWTIRFVLVAAIYLGLPLGAALIVTFAYFTVTIPEPTQLRHKQSAPLVRILARDGSLIAERGGNASYVPIDFLPQHLIDAVLATEDRRFFEHWGVDPVGIVRALINNLRAGRLVEGGSSLSQQLAKNLFLGPERTLTRKLGELVLALWLEIRLSKRDILELYLNRVYFGAGAWGVEAAAQRFFAKSAQALGMAEAAVLAGLLKAPSRYSPELNPVLARARARRVLANMVEAGLLEAARGEQVARTPVRFAGLARPQPAAAGYAVDAVLERLPGLLAERAGEDLIIATTLDAGLQRRGQALVGTVMTGDAAQLEARQAALIVLDTEGAIRAIVGGRDYTESQFNRALKAKRQPGSAFKTFVYLAALESGLSPDSIVQDLPLLGAGWSPRNEGAGYRGAVSLREALAHSMNAASARLHLSLGAASTIAAARRLGIRSPLRPDASLALGTSELSLLELSAAYGVLANGGHSLEPHLILSVRSRSGELLFERKAPMRTLVVAPATAGQLTDMLESVVTSGTGRRAGLADRASAGKTGTSQDFRDAWFVGYTAQLIAGVWVGNDDGRPMRKVAGGGLPARLWHELMTFAHQGLPPRPLSAGATPDIPGPGAPRAGERAAADAAAARHARNQTDFFGRALEAGEAALAPSGVR